VRVVSGLCRVLQRVDVWQQPERSFCEEFDLLAAEKHTSDPPLDAYGRPEAMNPWLVNHDKLVFVDAIEADHSSESLCKSLVTFKRANQKRVLGVDSFGERLLCNLLLERLVVLLSLL